MNEFGPESSAFAFKEVLLGLPSENGTASGERDQIELAAPHVEE
jgi:hypothetical protein